LVWWSSSTRSRIWARSIAAGATMRSDSVAEGDPDADADADAVAVADVEARSERRPPIASHTPSGACNSMMTLWQKVTHRVTFCERLSNG